MPLWKLQPLDLSDPSWEASSHRGVVIVRAPDEAAARAEAQRAFGVKTRFSPGAGVKAPPWQRAALASAERIRDARYEEEGATEVLEPAFELPPG
jgi:hypothetical protein